MGILDKVERFIDDVLLLPDDVRDALEAGDAALEAELFGEAEKVFLEILAERPQLARASVGLAHARRGLGDVAGTLAALMEARALLPEDADLAIWTARLALEADELDAAVRAANDAARARAEAGGAALAEACALAAWAEWKRGRPDRAARELRKALSADPQRPDLQVALVEALAAAERTGAARATAGALDAAALSPEEAARVGQALVRLGASDAARSFLEVAAAAGDGPAKVALARDALAARDLETAEARARSAVAEGAGPAALVVLAEVLVAQGRPGDAAEAYAAAGAASHELGPWRDAARVAPREALGGILAGLEGIAPGDPVAEAARAWLEGREAPGSVEPRGHLANARARLDAGDARGALEALDAWAGARREGLGGAVDGDEAAELRRAALRALWRSDGEGEIDLAAAIDAVGRFATEHGLEPVARDARALRDELDRPLLLAVLGEFNAGKSTLINAFIGAGVAPMGIVPTTATLNVLRGGAERLVRVVRRDGSTREGDYASLASMLEEAELLGSEAAGAEAIDRVEIVLPSETLERVWILDAPGTNALDEAHEELAHEAARRADAVLWVFDAAQAGKLTETKMHRQIRAQGRRVLPVLNKVDRLKEGELERVATVVREGFGAAPIPLSAKKALKARLADDEGAYAASGFPGLLEALEASIFSQSRALKRAACAGRLARTLDGALVAEEEAERAHEARRAELAAEREALVERASDVVLAVDDAVRALDRDLDEAFEAAADEVLGFVRPRAHRFAEHGVHPEDRAFLADLLERRLRHALDRCEARLVARLRGVLHGAAAGGEGDAAAIGERVRGAIRPPLSAFWGYQRGVLAGGSLRRFFEEVLPRADLEREALAGALMRARSAPRDELRPPLVEAAEALHRALVQERDDAVEALAAERHHAAAAVFGPLRALREVLAEIAAAPARAPSLANGARDE